MLLVELFSGCQEINQHHGIQFLMNFLPCSPLHSSLCKLLSHCGEKHLLTFRTKHDPSASSLEADRPRSCSSKQWCNFKFPSTGASEVWENS